MQDDVRDSDRLLRLVDRMVRIFRVQSSSEPLSAAAGSALNTLESEGPQGITQLARTQGVSQPAMTQLVDRLVSEGLVERNAQSDDRRSVFVMLTDSGRLAVSERRARRLARFERDLKRQSDEHREAIAAALPALEVLTRTMLDSLTEDGPPAVRGAQTKTQKKTTKKEQVDE